MTSRYPVRRTVREVRIGYAGQDYSGSYEADDGEVRVSSPYGARAMAAGPKGPKATAEQLLLDIVVAYRRPTPA